MPLHSDPRSERNVYRKTLQVPLYRGREVVFRAPAPRVHTSAKREIRDKGKDIRLIRQRYAIDADKSPCMNKYTGLRHPVVLHMDISSNRPRRRPEEAPGATHRLPAARVTLSFSYSTPFTINLSRSDSGGAP